MSSFDFHFYYGFSFKKKLYYGLRTSEKNRTVLNFEGKSIWFVTFPKFSQPTSGLELHQAPTTSK